MIKIRNRTRQWTQKRHSKMAYAVRVGATSLRAPPGATDDVQFDGLKRMSAVAYRDLHTLASGPVARLPRHEGELSLEAGDGAYSIS